MVSPRNAILAAALLFAASVFSSIWSALQPQASALGEHTYGTERLGLRGLYETLEQLEIPVSRRTTPPPDDLPVDTTLVLWAPNPMLITYEPAHLQQVSEWVRAGGRVVISPGVATAEEAEQLSQLAESFEHFNEDVWSALGLEAVQVNRLIRSEIPERRAEDDPELVVSTVLPTDEGPATNEVKELYTYGPDLPVVETTPEAEVLWETLIEDRDGDPRSIATALGHGEGELVVVSDPTLLENNCLARGDNAVWGVRLLTDEGRRGVVFDEFYHGLSVRGNSWWLLTLPTYGTLAAAGLVVLGLWTWRSGSLLGPPLPAPLPSRRAIGEYIEAMSRFFLVGKDARAFLVRELQLGVYRHLCREFGVPPKGKSSEALVSAIRRRDPQLADQVRDAFEAAFELCQQPKRPDAESTRQVMAALVACLHQPAAEESRFRIAESRVGIPGG